MNHRREAAPADFIFSCVAASSDNPTNPTMAARLTHQGHHLFGFTAILYGCYQILGFYMEDLSGVAF